MSSFLSKMMNFALFTNFFIFVLALLSESDLTEVRLFFSFGDIEVEFFINFYVLIVAVSSIMVIGIIAGTNVMGSGLNDSSTKMVMKVLAFITLWIVLSLFTITFLSPLEDFGNLLWLLLTICYAIGFLEKIVGVSQE